MGVVYEAHDQCGGRPCALKLLREDLPSQHYATLRRGFLREMYIAALLYHPNVIALHDCGHLPDGRPFMVMELLTGSDLWSLLQQSPRLSLDHTFQIVAQIGHALHHAHQHHVIHRDIKPANIFLSTPAGPFFAQGAVVRAKLLDFGLAVLRRNGKVEDLHDGQIAGTPQYLAPEATWGQGADIDARSDQWALAVVTYRLLTGTLPFDLKENDSTLQLIMRIRGAPHAPLHQHLPDVPAHIERAVDRALHKHPGKRHDSVRDFVDALLGRTAHDQILAHLARTTGMSDVSPPYAREAVSGFPATRRPLRTLGQAVALTSLLGLPSDRAARDADSIADLAPRTPLPMPVPPASHAAADVGAQPAAAHTPKSVPSAPPHPTPELYVPPDVPTDEPPPAGGSPTP